MKRLLVLLMIVVGTAAYGATMANTDCCPCPSMNWCCGEFCVDGEVLFWRASDCPDDYALTVAGGNLSPDPAVSHVFTTEPSFDLGLRVGVRYDRDCWFADSRYIFFESSDQSSVSRPTDEIFSQGNFVATGAASNAANRLRYGYQDVNLRAGLNCLDNQCCQLYSWIEGRYAKLSSIRTVRIQNLAGGVHSNRATSVFEGGGLGSGLGIQTQFLSCLQVSTEIGIFGLFGQQRSGYTRAIFVGPAISLFPATYQAKAAFVPGFNLRTKVAYVMTYCNMDFSIYFAWEINEFFDAELMTDPQIAIDNGPNAPPPATQAGQLIGFRECTNLGFGGPSVGFTVCY